MNYYELQEFMKKVNPGKNILFEFDDYSIRQIECMYTEDKLHTHNHIQYEKCKVTVEGQDPIYAPIAPHRMLISASEVQRKIPKSDIFIHPEQIALLKDLSDKKDLILPQALKELSEISGLTVEQIEEKCKS